MDIKIQGTHYGFRNVALVYITVMYGETWFVTCKSLGNVPPTDFHESAAGPGNLQNLALKWRHGFVRLNLCHPSCK
jgi:hypothetical protein